MTENAEQDKNNQKLIHEIELEIKKLAIEGLPAKIIGYRIKKKYGKSIKELTGRNLTTILGFRERYFQAISGAKLVLKLRQNGLLDSWISLSKLMTVTDWVKVLTFVDVVWRYHHKKHHSEVRGIYNLIKEVVGGDVRVRIRSVSETREGVLAYRVWLLVTTKNKSLRKRRCNKWKDMKFKFEF